MTFLEVKFCKNYSTSNSHTNIVIPDVLPTIQNGVENRDKAYCALNPFSTQPTGNRNEFITPNNLFTVDFAVITAASRSAGRFLPDCKPSTIFVAVPI